MFPNLWDLTVFTNFYKAVAALKCVWVCVCVCARARIYWLLNVFSPVVRKIVKTVVFFGISILYKVCVLVLKTFMFRFLTILLSTFGLYPLDCIYNRCYCSVYVCGCCHLLRNFCELSCKCNRYCECNC